MTQLIVTIDNVNHVSLISKAIALLRGVVGVDVYEAKDKQVARNKNVSLDSELSSIMGIASALKDIDVTGDERFSHIMNK